MSFFKRVAAVVAAAAAAVAVTAAPARAGGYELYQTQEFWCVGVQELPHLGAGPWVETVQLCQVVAGVNVTAYIPDSYCNCVAFYTPNAWVNYQSLFVRLRIDGTTTHVPILTTPPGSVGTPTPICVYSYDPFHPRPCLI